MSPIPNGRVIFNEAPVAYPDPRTTLVYDTSETIDLETSPLNGGILVKSLVFSIDPYLRGRLRSPETKSYNEAFALGQPIRNFSVAVVLRSENANVKVGEHVYGHFPLAEYHILKDLTGVRKIENKEGIAWSHYTGIAGMPGKTAYYGWKAYAKAKKGETIFVTTGAGPVGSMVIQLAKLDGLKVIASAGSSEKVQFMKDIGADVAFNYKTESTDEILKKHGPIDIYWDHVGGEVLDLALIHAAKFARFIEVGLITGYNSGGIQPVKNFGNVLSKSLTIQGLYVGNFEEQYGEAFYNDIPGRIARGEIKYLEYVKHGLQSAGQLLVDVLKGDNFGKAVIIVADK
ncbi:NAD-P-binding protein [Schizopora paradoxa]|uniref:NAD-P-binding protein n=1 Tax=Schizopora paradoxa TaxID=27342 RepID=A0A0H2RKA6_9AGAM|nr:NAD-P-binding protein [Schizopora paradoxa]